MEKPDFKVAVKCFTFNQSSYIIEALDGFKLQQTSFPFVCCILDDHSNDGEPEVIEAYAKSNLDFSNASQSYRKETDYASIIFAPHKQNANCFFAILLLKQNLYKQENLKLSYIKEWTCNAKYEAICEGDDYWIDPLKMQKQVDYMDSHPDCSLCHTCFEFYYQNDNKYLVSTTPNIKTDYVTLEQVVSGYYVQTCTAMYKSVDYIELREKNEFLFNGYFMMGDFPTWYELRKRGYIHWMPDVTSVYRKNEGSATRANSVASYYRFVLSSAEIRYYVSKRDNLSKSLIDETIVKFRKALVNYLSFNPDFKSAIEFPYQLSWYEKAFIHFGVLAKALSFKLLVQHQLGRLYRRFRKTY